MRVYPIPATSLQRLRTAYATFEQTAQLVSEALGLPSEVDRRLDWDLGAFVTDEVSQPEVNNGVAVSA